MKRNKTKWICLFAVSVLCLNTMAQESGEQERLPMQNGVYEPTWESLAQYDVPEWFRDAKFGIWAHWGPQCEPESGDWYARHMYYRGHWQYNAHVSKYGDPAVFGFKDVINIWEAENWDPAYLVSFYKSVGARYFMALANHHDNFDLWDSDYQPWNSVNMGPKQNIVGRWAEECEKNGLRFGVSIHASHAWTWMEGSQDFDGKLTKEDGAGKWWEGYDPQDLYAQNHPRSVNSSDVGAIHSQWEWENGAAEMTEEYKTKFYNRTLDVINKYHPDIILIAGDIIDNNINDFTYAHIDALKKLYAPLGVYAVIGNHDYYSADAAALKSLIEKTNIKVLLDNVTYIQEKGIYIIGRDSLRHTNDNGSKRQNIVSLYNNIEDKSKPVIILDHVPKGLDDGRKINADIQISGHTHDGQTFPLNLIIKILTFLPHGMINDNGFYYFVSSGLGLWGPPVRVGTDSEILIINVKGKDL